MLLCQRHMNHSMEHRVYASSQTLQKKNGNGKMCWENAEAKLGWIKAQHAKRLQLLENE